MKLDDKEEDEEEEADDERNYVLAEVDDEVGLDEVEEAEVGTQYSCFPSCCTFYENWCCPGAD